MLVTLAATLACLLLQAPPSAPAGVAAPPAIVKPYRLNVRVGEELRLTDLAGKERVLFDEFKERALVVVFWSYKDPVSRHYARELAALEERHAGKLAVVLIDSNHDELVGGNDPLAKLREVVKAEQIRLPVLIDPGNKLADDFNAAANGQVFVLDANRFVRYTGGIDDDPKGERRAQSIPVQTWLADALPSVLAGKPPAFPETRPAGRPIKRAPRAGVPEQGTLPGAKQKPK